jgi:hypothetical protein
MALTHAVHKDGSASWRSDQCELRIHVAGAVVQLKYTGFGEAQFIPKVDATLRQMIAAGEHPHVFLDCWDMSNYEPQYRQDAERMIQGLRSQMGSVHMLVRSRIVAMGATVFNMMVGGFGQVYAERAKFDAARARLFAPAKSASP